jgi:hypothetical protein
MSYVFFLDVLRRMAFICKRFGTLCLFHLHRRVGTKCVSGCGICGAGPGMESPQNPQPLSHFILTRLWRLDRQSAPKRWQLNSIRRITSQKKHTTFKTRKKFEIKNSKLNLSRSKIVRRYQWSSLTTFHLHKHCSIEAQIYDLERKILLTTWK